ncbi:MULTISPECIES: 3-hydroxyacyl-CoA dehydrogenase/enoyl-CoA hydratase family protein [unclassified Novosphingobium]|uniref:3-hydroxyacyl-CoA dehydrogenase/enoyl-CoA hydratase family protein n=1 Tax=unclassified Novosphingobium TaxID=2644732 RepID=UPI0014949040|nr:MULTISPECIES: 3-hydroxyacyl-CoA dehydrogenase/enoyl-CoA hydratase family protein [unclassified Novosphingobium]MBB3357555.1 3-hydroxyacyl-CoA dehydrogenase [Novosphingobium sp. BK256]MBB3373781.1 3-hydroxyacyl-CoA dehydrogenase [Novosphingobium sp. BK280]MBB3378193.1 3-hydroxyacyl-CoA dehydrogenase [Novosphingobium sp. BK258]MBB3420022.1 3-hydroxyacyl-CoA dehydrogenase [Novosphingobium sp. BK267]MBB3447656.1 3-hydroxyacyl-CoA dehydrogenase [Novosphingobium sp. BK352]
MSEASPNDPIRKVCVIGAGTMGAGIAAQVANAGVPVLLLDIVRDPANRNAVAQGALDRLAKAEPAAFMSKRAAKLVEVGNIEDDLPRVAECDWVIEAIVERLDLKHALYEKLEGVRRPGTAVSSNTSTIPLEQLIAGRGADFARDFLITHFFNPPRYMRLLEVVAGSASDAALVARVSDFADRALGKTVVRAKDTPGFLANRVGTFWIQQAINAAIDLGLSVEEADAVVGKPMGVPKTGVFGLVDLVGIDLMPHLKASLTATLPQDDAYRAIAIDHPLIMKMIADGYTGRKGKGGFYRLNREAGKRKEAIDLATGEYRAAAKPPSLPGAVFKDLKALVGLPGKLGAYAWAVLAPTLSYAASLVPSASDDIVAIDVAMKLGYNWKSGPFELIDKLGTAAFAERLKAEGKPVPAIVELAAGRPFYRVEAGKRQALGLDGEYHDVARAAGVVLLEDIKLAAKPLLKTASAALWDVGDGVAALEFTGKMNALDAEVMKLIGQAIPLVAEKFKGLVIYNEGSHFSAGANLGLALFAMNIAAWGEIEKLVAGGQQAMKALKYAPFPVVGAPSGMALGGGCEVLLHCDAIQAHAESYIGLVECGVGLVPGWGGNGELLDRWRHNPALPKGPMPAVAKVFETVSTATVSKSAAQAIELGFLRPTDQVTMNRDRLLADAKARVLALAEGYQPPEPPVFRLPGAGGKAALDMAVQGFRARGMATSHDEVVSGALARILTGGDADLIDTVTEDELLAAERREFTSLVRNPATQARIEHMLKTGKPLRN